MSQCNMIDDILDSDSNKSIAKWHFWDQHEDLNITFGYSKNLFLIGMVIKNHPVVENACWRTYEGNGNF